MQLSYPLLKDEEQCSMTVNATMYAPCQSTFIAAAHPSVESRVSLMRVTTVQASLQQCLQAASMLVANT